MNGLTPLLTLDIPVRLTSGFEPAVLDVRVTPRHDGPFDPLTFDPSIFDVGWSYSEQPQIAAELDSSLAGAALARTTREPIIRPWRVSVGGRVVPWHRMLPGSYVEESIDGVTTFGFSVPRLGSGADRFMEPLGSPAAWLGVPGGRGAVEISAEFLTPAGRKSVPLVRDGVLDNSSADAATRTFAGGGAHGRVDRVPITFQAPPGHGQTSGTVVRHLLELAGVPATKIAISGGRRLYKELTLVDANAIQAANAILEPELKRVYHDDRSDTWRLLDYSGIEGKRVEVVIREADVLAALGSLGDSEAADAPTAITLTGSAQVTREECGRRTEWQVIESFAVREIRGRRYTQGAGGALTAVSWGGSPAALRLVRRQVNVREIDCETVVATESAVWEWFAPEGKRYELDTATGGIGGYRETATAGGWIYDEGAAADDSSPMYDWPAERFTLTSRQRDEHAYDGRNYRVGTTVGKGGWRMTEAPLKTRASTADAWEEEPFDAVDTTADGRPITHGERWYGPSSVYDEGSDGGLQRVKPPLILSGSTGLATGVEREDTTISVNGDGFVTQEETTITRWHIAPGVGRHLYQDTESTSPAPAWEEVERQVVAYAGAGESHHETFRARYDHNGKLIEGAQEVGIPGYLPAAEQRTDIVPPASAYDDTSEAAFALAASRQESRPIKVQVTAPALESVLTPWEQKGRTVEHAETEDDLAAVGAFELRQASAIGFDLPLPFNPLLRPAHRLVAHLPTLGWHFDGLIERARHTQEERVTWTQLSGRHDVV